jgi:predicted nucleotidyltransferase
LSALRRALRTEQKVRLAVLFGSFATGEETEGSDLDLLVALSDPSAGAVASLSARLGDWVGRDVQLVRLQEAERSPALMVDVLASGRVLVDRDGLWSTLKAAERRWRRRAAEDVPLEEAMADLEPSSVRTSTSTPSSAPISLMTRSFSTGSKRSSVASISYTTTSPSSPHSVSSSPKYESAARRRTPARTSTRSSESG